MNDKFGQIDKTKQFICSLLPPFGKYSEAKEWSHKMSVPLLSDEVAQLLRVIVAMHKPKKILEIGTGVGFSGHILLDMATKDCTLYTIELDQIRALKARELFKNSEYFDRVTVFLGDAKEIVPSINGSFDLIFMDGAKSNYLTFIPEFIRLLKKDGVLVCDNVLLKGNISGQTQAKDSVIIRNMKSFLNAIQAPPFVSSVLEIGDGVSISIKI